MEFLGAPIGAHAIDLHNHEAKFGQPLRTVVGREGLGHKIAVRPGIDLFDDGIFPFGIKMAGAEDDPIDVGRAITPLLPALRSAWLQYHVLTIFIGYAAFLLAFSVSVYYLVTFRHRRHDGRDELLHANDVLVRIGFLFLTFGIVTASCHAVRGEAIARSPFILPTAPRSVKHRES